MPTRGDLIGSWRLERAELLRDGLPSGILPFGERPDGVIHYLPDGRMAVLIAHDDRPEMHGGRAAADDAEWAKAARSFTGYAGTFDLMGERVVHHVDINSLQSEVGADYVRLATLDGDRLTLTTPPELPADQRAMRLTWRRLR